MRKVIEPLELKARLAPIDPKEYGAIWFCDSMIKEINRYDKVSSKTKDQEQVEKALDKIANFSVK